MLLLLLACTGRSSGTDPGPDVALTFDGDRPTNLLMISVDTLRKTSLEEGYAPFLASLAEGSVYTDANTTCSSWTEPGTTCALTGFRAEELGALPQVGQDGENTPDAATPTLASWMGDAGYHTTFFSANSVHANEFYSGDYQSAEILADAPAADLVDAALAVDLVEPWLLHVHFFDPHQPYYSEPACLGALEGHPDTGYDLVSMTGTRELMDDWDSLSAEDQAEIRAQLAIYYYAQVTCMDAEIQRLYETLDAAGALDDTLVSVWTDHGEQLLDHDAIGHGSTMWPEVNDGLMYWTAKNIVPRTITTPTTLQDLVPTTFNGLALPVPEVSGMEITEAKADRVVFGTVHSVLNPPQQQVTRSGVRLRYNWEGAKRLYRHATDPDEEHDDYDPAGEDEAALWELLTPEVDRVRPLDPEDEPVDPGP